VANFFHLLLKMNNKELNKRIIKKYMHRKKELQICSSLEQEFQEAYRVHRNKQLKQKNLLANLFLRQRKRTSSHNFRTISSNLYIENNLKFYYRKTCNIKK